MTTPYTTGQISLVNGSAMVTGVGTGWETALIIGGTIHVEVNGGNALPIADIGGDTAITAAIAWTGPTGTYDYALVRDTAYGQQTVANSQALADYIQRLNSTALSAVAGVSPLAQTLLLFTGPDTATTIALSGLINGADYDVQVNNLAGRAVYDSRPANFRVLVSNIGDGRSAIYSKNSNTAADWSAPAYITGAPGAGGPYTEITIGPTTTLPYGSQATVTVVPVDADTIRLDFGIPAGQNGTGTGDVVGPSSSADNELALFSGTGGKQIKRGPLLSSLGSGQNEAILALEIADLKGSRLGMKGGVADAFDDETGVATKTNATYDATNDWYVPTSTAGSRISGATPSGLVNTPANINDNNTATIGSWAGSDLTGVAINSRKLAQLDLGSVQTITKIEAVGYYQSVGANSLTGLYYSTDGVNWTQLGANLSVNQTPTTTSVTGSVSARYVALILFAGSYSGATVNLQDLNAYGVGTISNMTLRSVAYAAASVPTTGRIAVQIVETDTITPNADLIARMSRNGGTTWATGSLSVAHSLIGPKMLEAAGIDLTGMSSGTSMIWEITTANGKNVAVSGVVAQWS